MSLLLRSKLQMITHKLLRILNDTWPEQGGLDLRARVKGERCSSLDVSLPKPSSSKHCGNHLVGGRRLPNGPRQANIVRGVMGSPNFWLKVKNNFLLC